MNTGRLGKEGSVAQGFWHAMALGYKKPLIHLQHEVMDLYYQLKLEIKHSL